MWPRVFRFPVRIPCYLAVLVLACALLAAYSNSFSGPFVFDDVPSITENRTLRHWSEALNPPARSGFTVSGRPLLNLSLAINYAIGGESVTGYHVANLLIHFAASLALFGLVRRAIRLPRLKGLAGDAGDGIALLVALLWAVHPLETESVTYVIQRAESLAGLFYLLTLYGFVRAQEDSRRSVWFAVSVTACALGMASKEVLVSAPLMVLFLDRMAVSGNFATAWRERRGYYTALAATWLVLAVCMLSSGARGDTVGFKYVGPGEYAITQCEALVRYLRLVFWPNPLVLDYGVYFAHVDTGWWGCAVVLAGLVAAALWAFWRNRPEGWLGALFFALLLPTSSVIPVASQTMAEHRMYLALAPVLVYTIFCLYRWGRGWGLMAALVAIPAAGMVTYVRNEDFSSALRVWRTNTENWPLNARGWSSLGLLLLIADRPDEAVGPLQRCLELDPDNVTCKLTLCETWFRLGDIKMALAGYKEVLAVGKVLVKEDRYQALNNFGLFLLALGRADEGLATLRQAIAFMSEKGEARLSLGNALMTQGEAVAAETEFTAALRDPACVERARSSLSTLWLHQGRTEEAERILRAGLAVAPRSAILRCSLGALFQQSGRGEAALREWQDIVRENPKYGAVHVQLGLVCLGQGQFDDGVRHFETAARLGEKEPVLFATLGRVLMNAGRVSDGLGWLEKAVMLAPGDRQLAYFLAKSYLQAGRVEEAVAHYEALVKAGNSAPEIENELGEAHLAAGRAVDARLHFEAALRMNPGFTPAQRNLARMDGK